MDKLENETWEEYAFKNNLFKIKYADKEQQIIDDIILPNPNIINNRHYDSLYYMGCVNSCYVKIGFLEFIMHEIYTLREKYNTGCYSSPIQLVEQMTKEREEDIERQKWLFKELTFWEKQWNHNWVININTENEDIKKEKETKQREKDKLRYLELKIIISETHKAQLDELLSLFNHIRPELMKEEKQIEKNNRIELYQKFLKNKDIKSQINALEQKINKLKGEIV